MDVKGINVRGLFTKIVKDDMKDRKMKHYLHKKATIIW